VAEGAEHHGFKLAAALEGVEAGSIKPALDAATIVERWLMRARAWQARHRRAAPTVVEALHCRWSLLSVTGDWKRAAVTGKAA